MTFFLCVTFLFVRHFLLENVTFDHRVCSDDYIRPFHTMAVNYDSLRMCSVEFNLIYFEVWLGLGPLRCPSLTRLPMWKAIPVCEFFFVGDIFFWGNVTLTTECAPTTTLGPTTQWLSIKTPCIWCMYDISLHHIQGVLIDIHHIQGVLIDSHCEVGNIYVWYFFLAYVWQCQEPITPSLSLTTVCVWFSSIQFNLIYFVGVIFFLETSTNASTQYRAHTANAT